MQTKLIAFVAALAFTTGIGGSALAASPASCPEVRTACQPAGDRSEAQKPKIRPQVTRPKLTPKVDSSGQRWRAGTHIMY